jgi:hypothetical protein
MGQVLLGSACTTGGASVERYRRSFPLELGDCSEERLIAIDIAIAQPDLAPDPNWLPHSQTRCRRQPWGLTRYPHKHRP